MTNQQWDPGQVAGKTALSTIIVIVTLVVVFCVLPLLSCLFFGVLGNMMG